MSYAAAIDQLSAMAPELHTQPGQQRRKFSLAEIGALLTALKNPHRRYRSVLIAGTNGKGSTASTLASILQASGVRTGLYTSPHLVRPNERIRVNGVEISDGEFAGLYFRIHDRSQELVLEQKLAQLPSFFETLTAMALLHFAEQGVEIAVLEVGMGGRLDATNIVDPLLSIVTDISLDHTEWLGPAIAAIAREKAGILRPSGTLITLPQHPEANQVLGEVATALGTRAVSAVPYMPERPHPAALNGGGAMADDAHSSAYPVQALGGTITVDSPLHGDHQHRNIALAIAAAVELATHHGLPVTAESVEQGIRRTNWPGRLERIDTGGVDWVLDVAHNPAGAWALRAALRSEFGLGEEAGTRAVLVFGCLRDKPLSEMAQILFGLFEEVIFAPIASPRATPMAELLAAAEAVGVRARAAELVEEALAIAEASTAVSETVAADRAGGQVGARLRVVAGSVYLVGEVRPLLLARAGLNA